MVERSYHIGLRIRLRRTGLRKQPSYRVVITDQRSPRDGNFIEIIGHHNPRTQPITDVVDEARAGGRDPVPALEAFVASLRAALDT